MPSSSGVPITPLQQNITAPTPQNTPLTSAPIAQGLSRPTVPDIEEGSSENDDGDDGDEIEGGGIGELGKSSGYIESLPVEQKRTLEALVGLQGEWEGLQGKFKKEVLELEKKYLGLYQPLFDRRAALINGASAPTPAEIAAGEEISKEDDPDYTPLPPAEANASGPSPATSIPEFWLTALRNRLGINELITERDAVALKSLIDIKVSYDVGDPAKTGFVLKFEFAPNEFFEEKVLTKTYLYKDEISPLGDYVYSHAIGCPITWKSDAKDLTKEIEIKKQRNKNTNRTRVIRKSKPADSWFNFFDPPKREENEDEDEEEWDEALEDRLELDYQVGEDLKERIIPHAVDYFTGKALEYDSLSELGSGDEDMDSEEDDSDEPSDEIDDDDEDDEDDDEDGPRVHRARKALNVGNVKKGGRKGGAAMNVDPEQCKQQ